MGPSTPARGTRSQHCPTPSGPARWHLDAPPDDVRRLLVLGHGAGGGVEAPDLLAARDGALEAGWACVRVEQPWRVAGRRVAEAPPRLDAAWLAVLEDVRRALAPELLVAGGRSAGARVACRTSTQVGAAAVLALAFPLVAPRGADRSAELRAPAVPRLVVQGERDAFGVPQPGDGVRVHVVAGADHAFAVRGRDGRTAEQVADELREVVRERLREPDLQTLT